MFSSIFNCSSEMITMKMLISITVLFWPRFDTTLFNGWFNGWIIFNRPCLLGRQTIFTFDKNNLVYSTKLSAAKKVRQGMQFNIVQLSPNAVSHVLWCMKVSDFTVNMWQNLQSNFQRHPISIRILIHIYSVYLSTYNIWFKT